jgi:hypothetical protein
LVGKTEAKRLLKIYRRRCEDNVGMDLWEIRRESVDWIYVAHDRMLWRAVVRTIMSLPVPQKGGNVLHS